MHIAFNIPFYRNCISYNESEEYDTRVLFNDLWGLRLIYNEN